MPELSGPDRPPGQPPLRPPHRPYDTHGAVLRSHAAGGAEGVLPQLGGAHGVPDRRAGVRHTRLTPSHPARCSLPPRTRITPINRERRSVVATGYGDPVKCRAHWHVVMVGGSGVRPSGESPMPAGSVCRAVELTNRSTDYVVIFVAPNSAPAHIASPQRRNAPSVRRLGRRLAPSVASRTVSRSTARSCRTPRTRGSPQTQEPPSAPARRGFLTCRVLSRVSHQHRRRACTTRPPPVQTAPTWTTWTSEDASDNLCHVVPKAAPRTRAGASSAPVNAVLEGVHRCLTHAPRGLTSHNSPYDGGQDYTGPSGVAFEALDGTSWSRRCRRRESREVPPMSLVGAGITGRWSLRTCHCRAAPQRYGPAPT